ncbi:MAG: TspO/MBR family protein [Acutalibacteraceae bacterium]|nr:TspO/MBR family protein [Acutalibacteraceae bacterium]
MIKNINLKQLAISLFISLGVGILASILTADSFMVYSGLTKPPLSPPAWLFPVVWTILYILMGISAYMVYQSDDDFKYVALVIYGVQLIFNFFWSIIYFNMGNVLFAFVWLIMLWVLIVAMIISFAQVNKTAALLQIPYLLWVTFAGYLNLALYLLNRPI